MAVGRNIMRRGVIRLAAVADGAAGSAITVAATVWPNGAAVERRIVVAGGAQVGTEALPWGGAVVSGLQGNATVAATRPAAAGRYVVEVRLRHAPRTIARSNPFTVA